MADKVLADYMLAADNHNLAASGTSWLDPQTWQNALGNVGKYTATAILSGANSFYNTAATVGQWAGLDIADNPTDTWISGIDSDLGQYYRANQESVDLGGFVLASLIPGLAGVKVLNAGQKAITVATKTGLIGGNLAKATGLLVPSAEKYVALSAAQINSSATTLSLINANTIKALAAGVWQNTLEAAAFETAVQATMFKSPILDQQDMGDVAKNIMWGGAFGGVIGGAFAAAKTVGTLKKSVDIERGLRRPFIERPVFADITPDSERIIQLAHDSEFALRPNLATSNFDVKAQLVEDKLTKNFNDIRNSINNLANKDTELGNMVANISAPVKREGQFAAGFSQEYFENYSGAVRVVRAVEATPEEKAWADVLLNGLKDANQDVPEVATRYIRTLGEGAGQVADSKPTVLYLADMYKGEAAIKNAVRDYKFDIDKVWDARLLKGNKAHLEAEARYIWAQDLLKEIPEKSVIAKHDIPLLERAYKDGQINIRITSGSGPSLEVVEPVSRSQLLKIIEEAKTETAAFHGERMLKGSRGAVQLEGGTEAVAKITNTKVSWLEGTVTSPERDLFAMQDATAGYQKVLQDRGLGLGATEAKVDPRFLPKYAKVVYQVDKDISSTTPSVLDAVVFLKQKQKLYEDGAKNVFATIAGPRAQFFPDISDSALLSADRTGSGAGLFSSENSNYGTLGSSTSYIGSGTRELKQQLRKETLDAIEGPLIRLGQHPESAIEFESINQKVTRSGQLWIRHSEDGVDYLVTKRAFKAFAERENITGRFDEVIQLGDYKLNFDDLFAAFPEDLIKVKNKQAAEFIDAHIAATGRRTDHMSAIRAQQGHALNYDSNTFRPIRPDLRRYPHFAFVTDESVTGSGHVSMIHAASEKDLAALVDKVPPRYTVRTKDEVEQYFKARHEFEYGRTLNENYIDSELKNNGIFSNFFPKSDPQKIVDDVLAQHTKESEVLAVEAVRLRYENVFNLLEDLGKQYSKFETSKFASKVETLEKTANNPYFNLVKTALDISKINEHPLLYSFNKTLDEAVSKAVGAIRDFKTATFGTEDLERINGMLDKFGMKPAYYDAALQALANHSAPRGELTKFVRRANSALSLFTLGLDPLNALNNAVGANILRMTELRAVTDAIKNGNTELAGDLGKLAKIALPGTGDQVLAPTKLVAAAIKNFWQDDGTLLARYKNLGLIKDRAEQLKLLVDDFTLKGTETVSELSGRMSAAVSKIKGIADAGERFTLNKFAEEFNRFISANVMDQITAVGMKHGIFSPAEANAYINTFVSRVEGNIVASQRPLIFQGPIGQAISLFQSYQFNLLQQLFRYVQEGSGKDLAMLAGLQGTLYGIQGLPAFQFINTHILGQLSGNKEHRDAYDAVYGIAGRTAGDFVLYGLPSNILQTNIYSRGDINPRQLTILPTTLQEIPIVSGWGKLLISLKDSVSKIAGGANVWESILQGIEHNGISRPLAGFAQTFQAFGPGEQAYSTTGKGSILFSNDLFSLASLTRLSGGRPLDEAIANDTLFRVKTYEAARRKDMQSLAENVKTTLIQGNVPDEDQINRFVMRYADLGGKQAGFNKWMMSLYKNANVAQSEQIRQSLSNPFAYKMQLLMGGTDE